MIKNNLYSRDHLRNLVFWSIRVDRENGFATIKTRYGRVGGKIASATRTITKGKNLGRSNETTPYEQAILESMSAYTSKLKEGYVDVTNDKNVWTIVNGTKEINLQSLERVVASYPTDHLDRSKPMKAQPYYKDLEETKIRMKFPCFGQPKVNGVRAIAEDRTAHEAKSLFDLTLKIQIRSKKGMEYPLMRDIERELSDMFPTGMDFTLDGELWSPEIKFLGDVTHAVRTHCVDTDKINFYIFDIAEPNISQIDRLKTIEAIIPAIDKFSRVIRLPAIWIKDDADAQQFTDECIAAGYEGAVFRTPEAYYEFGKRPTSMTKLKRTIDAEFAIVDIKPEAKDPSRGLFVCITPEGKMFTVTPTMTHEQKQDVMSNPDKYIGKELTVIFYEYTKDKKPFHIRKTILRDYE